MILQQHYTTVCCKITPEYSILLSRTLVELRLGFLKRLVGVMNKYLALNLSDFVQFIFLILCFLFVSLVFLVRSRACGSIACACTPPGSLLAGVHLAFAFGSCIPFWCVLARPSPSAVSRFPRA